MDSALDWHSAKALLEWQIELGATDAVCDAPIDRFALAKTVPAAPAAAAPVQTPAERSRPEPAPAVDPVAVSRTLARQAGDLAALRGALENYEHCELKRGARRLVFSDGVPGARVMIVGEAPGREEDREGRPFVGRAGQLLDRMLDCIGLSRAENVYIANVIPWRPPQNREPRPDEIAMMRPFLERHIELAAPEVLVLVGNISCLAVLEKKGILRLRGQRAEAFGRPVLPMVHPAYLLRTPTAKREAWADLLQLQAMLRG